MLEYFAIIRHNIMMKSHVTFNLPVPSRSAQIDSIKNTAVSLAVAVFILLTLAYFTGHLSTTNEMIGAGITVIILAGLAFVTWRRQHLGEILNKVLVGVLAAILAFDIITGSAGGQDVTIAVILALMIAGIILRRPRK